MKLKYATVTGEIICIGNISNLTAGPGETVVDVSLEMPAEPLNYFTFNGEELVRKNQSVIDAMLAIQNFSFKLLWGEIWSDALGVISNTGKVELPPYAKTIEDMWNYPNRAGVYPYMQMLVAAGKGTSDDLAIIVSAFSQQGIDITTIQ